MASPSPLIEHTKERLIQQRRINICGLYLPPLLVAVVLGAVLIRQFSFSPAVTFLPALALALWMGRALRRAGKAVETVAVAALIDEKTDSQERFLTLATVSPSETHLPFVALVRRQTEEKAAAFSPRRAFPFSLDRRVFLTIFASALSLLVLFLLPLESAIVPPASPPLPDTQQEQELEKLADFARSLMRDGKTPQEKTAGAQLLALAEQLKNPTIPPEEKRRLIEETKQRMEVPLPQILPFQLDFFAGKDDKEKNDQNSQSQQDGKQQDKNNQNPDPAQTPQQSAVGNQQQQEQKEQPGSQQGDKKNEQQKPQESGGGIKFNQPKPEQQGEKREQSGQDSGEQQQANQNQSPDSRTQGTDPNKPGNQDGPGQDPQKQGQGPQPSPQQPGQEKKGAGSTVGGSPGERFLKPGEQPGGFLTKDARFVKVRIPFGDAPQGEGENLTENYARTQPKTPYSNAPLKEAPPDQVQAKQPVPLEYRTILK